MCPRPVSQGRCGCCSARGRAAFTDSPARRTQRESKNHRKSRSQGSEAEVLFAPKSTSLRPRLPFLNSPRVAPPKTLYLLDEACRSHHISRPFSFDPGRWHVLILWLNRKLERAFPRLSGKNPAKELPKSVGNPPTRQQRKARLFPLLLPHPQALPQAPQN